MTNLKRIRYPFPAVVLLMLFSLTAFTGFRAYGESQQSAGKDSTTKSFAETDNSKSVTVKLSPKHGVMNSLVRYYRPKRISLSEKPQEELRAEPDYVSEKPLYGTMKLGSGKDNLITLVIDEVEGKVGRIYIDRDNDEDLTNDGSGKWTRTSGSTLGLSGIRIEVDYESGTTPYTFEFYRFKSRLRDTVLYYRNSCREGSISSGAKNYKIAVLDENSDGRFDDLSNGTLLIDLDGDGKLIGSSDSAEYHKLGAPFNIHGKVWEVASLSPDGSSLTLRPSKAKLEMRRYLQAGYQAPTFDGKGLDGKSIDVNKGSAKEKYVLLDFWASWCGPCRREYPYLRRLHVQYKDHGLRIIGVSLDTDRQKAIQMAKDELLDYPHVFDGKGWKNAVAALYRVRGIPQTYLLDKDLKIVAKGLRGSSLETRMRQLLGPGDLVAAAAMDKRKPASTVVTPQRPSRSATVTAVVRDPKATFSKDLSIFLACGNVLGSGKVVQVDGYGKVLGAIALPNTPYGIASLKDGLVAAIPRAGTVLMIDTKGNTKTILEKRSIAAPIAVAVGPQSGDILVPEQACDERFFCCGRGRWRGA